MNKEDLLNSDFLKQFKDSKDFGSFIDELYKRGVETLLEGELEAHLGYSKSQSRIDDTNARNGYGSKMLKTEHGNIDLHVPRDRNASFESLLVPKRSRLSLSG